MIYVDERDRQFIAHLTARGIDLCENSTTYARFLNDINTGFLVVERYDPAFDNEMVDSEGFYYIPIDQDSSGVYFHDNEVAVTELQ